MSREIPSFMLADGRAPQIASIVGALGAFQAHFETWVRPQSDLSQTSSATYNSIFG
jgi:hypothetical protein